MKESIGYTVTLNIIIIFILVTFAVIFGIVSYSKAYRANSKIVNAIEKYEGYNSLSLIEINNNLTSLGYSPRGNTPIKCKATRNGGTLVEDSSFKSTDEILFNYCVYKHTSDGDYKHMSYGVVTYLEVDFSFFGTKLRLPVYAKTRRIYIFSN